MIADLMENTYPVIVTLLMGAAFGIGILVGRGWERYGDEES